MRYIVIPCVAGVMFYHVMLAAVIQPEHLILQPPESGGNCSFKGVHYNEGEKWTENCQLRCTCQKESTTGIYYTTCVSRCPPQGLQEGCKFEYKSDRDPETNTNCCPEKVCFEDCEGSDGSIIKLNEIGIVDNIPCGCSEGKLKCFNKTEMPEI